MSNGTQASEAIFELHIGEDDEYGIQQFEVRKVGLAGGISAIAIDGTTVTVIGPARWLADVFMHVASLLRQDHGGDPVKAIIIGHVDDQEAA